MHYAGCMAADDKPADGLAPGTDPERLAMYAQAEQEAERISAIMGPEWAAGMYD